MNAIITHARRGPEANAVAVMAGDVKLGKDVLELLSTAMYVDPLVVFREYVQNAADAIDAARARQLLAPDAGLVDIQIDPQSRSVRIRDDGAGLTSEAFLKNMVALGGSQKRGTAARGFRGVGRLAGLGHAQELVFRCRCEGEDVVNEMRWDGRELRAHLADQGFDGGLSQMVAAIVKASSRKATDEDAPRFFEVELLRIPRGRSDKLLSVEDVSEYLSQIAPVPFHPDFAFGDRITRELSQLPGFSQVTIQINGGEPLTRPHRDTVDIGGRPSAFVEPVFVQAPSQDGTAVAAFAWFLHHGYEGALTVGTQIKGLRLRVGNLQIGDGAILEGLFTETRFNSWSVGEVHVLDPRLIPNGRRDQFEQNAHYANLLNHLLPTTRDIANRCRTYSARRSKLREFEVTSAAIEERLSVLRQGGLGEAGKSSLLAAAEAALQKLKTIVDSKLLSDDRDALEQRIACMKSEVAAVSSDESTGDPLSYLEPEERAFYQRMFGLIYRHSANQVAAKSLVDRILVGELDG